MVVKNLKIKILTFTFYIKRQIKERGKDQYFYEQLICRERATTIQKMSIGKAIEKD